MGSWWKIVTVSTDDYILEFDEDSIMIELATRVIADKLLFEPNTLITSVCSVSLIEEKKKTPKNIRQFSTYVLLINAGLFREAECLSSAIFEKFNVYVTKKNIYGI